MITKLKLWLLAGVGAFLAAGSAILFKMGERRGIQKSKHAETKRRLKSMQDMKEIEHDVSQQDDPHLVDTLTRWVQDDKRG